MNSIQSGLTNRRGHLGIRGQLGILQRTENAVEVGATLYGNMRDFGGSTDAITVYGWRGTESSDVNCICEFRLKNRRVQDFNSYESTIGSHSDIVLSCWRNQPYHRP